MPANSLQIEHPTSDAHVVHDAGRIQVAKDVVENSFLTGNPSEPPAIEDLRRRFSFITSVMKKIPEFDHPELIDKALLKYHDIRENNASATFTGEDLPGWRLMILRRSIGDVHFAGVRDDGVMEQGRMVCEECRIGKRPRAITLAKKLSRFFDETRGREAKPAATRDDRYYTDSWRDQADETGGEKETQISWETWLPLSPYSNTARKAVDDTAKRWASLLTDFVEAERFGRRSDAWDEEEDGPDEHGDVPMFDNENDVPLFGAADDINHGNTSPAPDASRRLYKLLEVALSKSAARQTGAMAANAMRALDKETSSLLHAVLEPNRRAANWVSGVTWSAERGRHIDPTVARNRRQALKAYPLLAIGFIDGNHGAQKVIDEGKDLSGHLAQHFDVSPALVRRLSGLTWQKVGRYAHHAPKIFITCLAATDINQIPQTRRGFEDMRVAYSAAVKVSERIGEDRKEMMKSIGGRFAAIAGQVEGNPPEGVADLAKDIRDRVLIPGIIQREIAGGMGKKAAMEVARSYATSPNLIQGGQARRGGNILKGHSLRTALQASERWHRALPRLNDELGDGSQFGDPRSNVWEPLLGDLDLKDGLTATELSSIRDLKHEGLVQNHCVGGYGSSVKSAKCLIFSIRNGDKILSTAEIRMAQGKDGTTEFSLGQNYAKGNQTPDAAAKRAAHVILSRVRKLEAEKVEDYRRTMNSIRAADREEQLCQNAGYDIFDRQGLEKAHGRLKEYLPKKTAKLSLDQWVDHIVEGKPQSKLASLRQNMSVLHR